MEIFSSTIFFLILFSSIHAQERWGSYESGLAGNHFQLIETCYDTVEISPGLKAERLYISSGFPFERDLGRIVSGDSVLIVNLMSTDAPRLLYNYGLEVGETIDVIFRGEMEVIEKREEFILGKDRSILVLEEKEQLYQDTWIEGIGSIKNGYLQPGMPDIIFDAGSIFSCYYTEQYDEWYQSESEFYVCLADSINSGCFISSIEDYTETEVKIFPNPTQDVLNIQILDSELGASEYQIVDVNGRLICHDIMTSDSQVVDLSILTDGIYLLRVFSDDIQSTTRFVKSSR